jgi:putative salt-induced outer membrane protein YdiY
MKQFLFVLLFVAVTLPMRTLAADPESPGTADSSTASNVLPALAPMDIVMLKDGSTVFGEVVEMSEGTLHIKTPAGPDGWIKVKWSEVAKLTVTHPLPFHLKEGSVIVGTAAPGTEGTLNLQIEPLKSPLAVPLDSVASVNPLIQPPVVYTGNLQGAYSQASGNSHLRSATLIGEFIGRSEYLRLTLLGRYVYGDDAGRLQVRNSRGTIKLDFFVTKKFYWFASAYFEQDTFQDLNLRTALASGPGYQFIEKGDYASPWLKDLTLYAEAGLAYYNVDFKTAQDQTSFRARWSLKFNWPIMDEKVTVYHFDEFFPSLQDAKDYYLTSDTGVRFKLIGGFVSSFQWTLRYNSRPAPGTKDTDNLYMITLGYAFDTSRKRS